MTNKQKDLSIRVSNCYQSIRIKEGRKSSLKNHDVGFT